MLIPIRAPTVMWLGGQAAALLLAACGPRREQAEPTDSGLEPPREITSDSAAIITSTSGISPSGLRVYAWVAARQGVRGGRLYLMTDSLPAAEIPDPKGAAGTDPETPPKLGFGPRGEIYLAYQVVGSTPEGGHGTALRVRRSQDRGRSWSEPSDVADDGPWARYRNDHAFHVTSDGTLYLAWVDARIKPKYLIYTARSDDGGATWSSNVVADPEQSCECCRVALASTNDGRVFLAWRKQLPGGIRDIVVASSADRGASWSRPVVAHADNWEVGGCPDAGPSMLADSTGRLHLAWWTGKTGAAGVKYVTSTDGGKTWREPIVLKVSEHSRPSHPQLGRNGAGALAVVWDDGTVEDRPILLALSRDDGATFAPPRPVSPPGLAAGFPTVTMDRSGFVVAWAQRHAAAAEARQLVRRAGTLGDR